MSAVSPSGWSPFEQVVSRYLFTSDFYEVKSWAFDFKGDHASNLAFNDCFCVVFIKRGNFKVDLSPRRYDMHTGHVVIEKANYEYRIRPAAGECSIFNFTDAFYERFTDDYGLKRSFFFANPNILSLLLNTSPEIDYLHYQVMDKLSDAGKLEMDNLVFELLRQIVECITNKTLEEVPASLRRNHITTIERAKEYLNANFSNDISLNELASHCCVSPFHFCRTFKKFTSYSPHQYLLNIRLKHAEMLVRNTSRPIADVCFSSGFNSVEYFATAFKQKFKLNPTQYRKE